MSENGIRPTAAALARDMQAELETLQSINGGYVRDKEVMQRTIDSLTAELEAAKAENEKLHTRVFHLTGTRAGAEVERDALAAKVRELQTAIKDAADALEVSAQPFDSACMILRNAIPELLFTIPDAKEEGKRCQNCGQHVGGPYQHLGYDGVNYIWRCPNREPVIFVSDSAPKEEQACDCQDYANGYFSMERQVHNLYPAEPPTSDPEGAGEKRYRIFNGIGCEVGEVTTSVDPVAAYAAKTGTLRSYLLQCGYTATPINRKEGAGEKCGTCDGSGAIDSGGVTPWGAPIDIPCPECRHHRRPINRTEGEAK